MGDTGVLQVVNCGVANRGSTGRAVPSVREVVLWGWAARVA